ncbi:MAG: hypothetical protein VW124_15060, partial [Paracoccaceae bacterium]
ALHHAWTGQPGALAQEENHLDRLDYDKHWTSEPLVHALDRSHDIAIRQSTWLDRTDDAVSAALQATESSLVPEPRRASHRRAASRINRLGNPNQRIGEHSLKGSHALPQYLWVAPNSHLLVRHNKIHDPVVDRKWATPHPSLADSRSSLTIADGALELNQRTHGYQLQ